MSDEIDPDDIITPETGIAVDHLAALGEVTLWSAHLGDTVGRLVVALAKDDERGSGVVEPKGGFESQVKQARALLEHSPNARKMPDISRNLDAARVAMDRRNELVHGYWLPPMTSGERNPSIQVPARIGRPERRESVTVETVRALSTEIVRIDSQLWLQVGVVDGWIHYYPDERTWEMDAPEAV
jgi:hypothetical protein